MRHLRPHVRFGVALVATILAVSALTGCGAPVVLGTLDVVVAAPSDLDLAVHVTGPDGFDRTLDATATLTGLAPGSYAVTAPPARRPAAVVDELWDATTVQVDVDLAAGAAEQVAVTYARRAGTGRMWIAVYGEQKIVAFTSEQLEAGGADPTPDVAIGFGVPQNPYALAFDAAGNAWVGMNGDAGVWKVDKADLATSGTPAPAAVLDVDGVDVNGLAFAPDGSLWVASSTALSGFSPATLALAVPTGTAPDVVLNGTATNPLVFPHALAFAADGYLWVATSDDRVVAYAPGQLVASGAPEPAIVIASNGTSLQTVRGIAFDAAGALWAANWSSNTAVKFRPEDLAASGAPDPVVTLGGLGVNPLRLAFDNRGDLWMSSNFAPGFAGGDFVGRVAATDLVSSGTPPLATEFTDLGNFDAGGTLVFAAMPAALPGSLP
jgi:sugar lactone lactonase YvrE